MRRAVGEVTLDLVLTSVADATLEKVLEEVLKVIPADDSGGECAQPGAAAATSASCLPPSPACRASSAPSTTIVEI